VVKGWGSFRTGEVKLASRGLGEFYGGNLKNR
jgi:hypothetical protein